MRLVTPTAEGTLELNWMFLPTFIGMNNQLRLDLDKELTSLIEGLPWTESTFDLAHDKVVDALVTRFKIPGLRDYLEAVKYVESG